MSHNVENLVTSSFRWVGNSIQRIDRHFAIPKDRKRNPSHYFHPQWYFTAHYFKIHLSKTHRLYFQGKIKIKLKENEKRLQRKDTR